jgi:hypothetical protein
MGGQYPLPLEIPGFLSLSTTKRPLCYSEVHRSMPETRANSTRSGQTGVLQHRVHAVYTSDWNLLHPWLERGFDLLGFYDPGSQSERARTQNPA